MEKKTYAVSDITKHAMSASLKRLMAQKKLDKITIREIMDGCGMKRQNFYYHFEDIYALVKWMFQEEAISLLQQHEGTLLWQDGLLQVFRYLEENRAVCLCALESLGREHIKQFFQGDISKIIQRTIEELAQSHGFGDSEDNIRMLTRFYSIALWGIVESWVLGEINKTPEELIQFVDVVLQDHMRGAELRLSGADAAAIPEKERKQES